MCICKRCVIEHPVCVLKQLLPMPCIVSTSDLWESTAVFVFIVNLILQFILGCLRRGPRSSNIKKRGMSALIRGIHFDKDLHYVQSEMISFKWRHKKFFMTSWFEPGSTLTVFGGYGLLNFTTLSVMFWLTFAKISVSKQKWIIYYFEMKHLYNRGVFVQSWF